MKKISLASYIIIALLTFAVIGTINSGKNGNAFFLFIVLLIFTLIRIFKR